VAQSATGTTTLSVGVVPESSLVVNTGTTSLGKLDTTFGNYTGTTSLTFKVRTLKLLGTGAVTAQLTEFAGGSAGPHVATDLRYSSTTTVGTAVTGATPSTSAATNVITFGANAHSAAAGTGASVAWTLGDDPTFETGTYTSTVTFTISAS
jgi:hypothetical protein